MPAVLAAAYPDTRPHEWQVYTDDRSCRVWVHGQEFSVRVTIGGGAITEQVEDASEVRLELTWDGRAGPTGRWVWSVRSPNHLRAETGIVNGQDGYISALTAARQAARAVAEQTHVQVPHQWRPGQ